MAQDFPWCGLTANRKRELSSSFHQHLIAHKHSFQVWDLCSIMLNLEDASAICAIPRPASHSTYLIQQDQMQWCVVCVQFEVALIWYGVVDPSQHAHCHYLQPAIMLGTVETSSVSWKATFTYRILLFDHKWQSYLQQVNLHMNSVIWTKLMWAGITETTHS